MIAMNSLNELEQQLLSTLSYFEPMTLEFIYLDMDKNFLEQNPNYSIDDLQLALKNLTRQKKIKAIQTEGQLTWVKIYPKKSLFKRLFSYFR